MSLSSESRPGRLFKVRWRFKFFQCHGCGVRMTEARDGVLTLTDAGRLQWACLACYDKAEAAEADGA